MARVKAILRRKGRDTAPQSALNGDIKEIGLGDLLQNLSGSLKTGTITFADMDGELVLAGGNIISARQGISKGMEAVFRLLLLEHGHFTVSYHKIPDLKTEQLIPIMKALLNGVHEVDQIRIAVEETTGQKDPFLELAGLGRDDPSYNKIQSKFPCRFMNLVTAMDDSLKENVYKTLKAIHTNKILCLKK